MNQYKSRAKCLKHGNWVYGFYVHDEEWAKHYIYHQEKRGAFFQLSRTEVDEKTVGKSLCLKDKSAKEIFDGDLLRVVYKMGRSAEWYTDGIYVANFNPPWPLAIVFAKINEEGAKNNQHPLAINLEFGKELSIDYVNSNRHHIAVNDKYYSGYKEHHYSNDIEIIGNKFDNSNLLTP